MGIVELIVGVLLVLLFGLLVYYEAFSQVVISEKTIEPFWLVYETHIGAYRKSVTVMDKIYYDLLNKESIETTRGFGLYYDDPKTTAKESLRSIAGCILENCHEGKIEELKKTYKIKQFLSSESVVVEFPYYGKLSVLVGIFKVYPKLNEYIKAKGYPQVPIMEVYDAPQKRIRYVASIHLEKTVFENFLS